jgi:hypothetical protein
MTILGIEKSGVVLQESGTEVTAMDKVYLYHHVSSGMRGPSPAAVLLVQMANSCGRSLFSSRFIPGLALTLLR